MKITIITASYNSVLSIKDCVQSVINQTYFDKIEYIIIDNCSTDGTLDILKSYSAQISCIVSEPDAGIFDAMNKGIKLASGDVIGFLHSDDIYADNFVIEQVANKLADTNSSALYGDLQYITNDVNYKVVRNWIAGNYNISKLKRGWMPPHPTFFVRKQCYLDFGMYNTDYKIASDYDLMMRLLFKHKISCSYLNKVLVKMRMGGVSNNGLKNIIQKSNEDLSIIKSLGLGSYPTLIGKNISKIKQFF